MFRITGNLLYLLKIKLKIDVIAINKTSKYILKSKITAIINMHSVRIPFIKNIESKFKKNLTKILNFR